MNIVAAPKTGKPWCNETRTHDRLARIEKKLEQRYRRVMLLVTVSVFAIGLIKQISIFNEEMIVWEIIGNFAAFGLWQIGYTHMSGMKRTKSC